MMKIMFLLNDIIDHNSGVGKKIVGQASALSKMSSKFYFVESKANSSERIVNSEYSISESLVLTPLFLRFHFENLSQFIIDNKINLVYIRYTHFSSPWFNRFLSKMSVQDVEIILEFPTFPYDQEYQSLGMISNLKLWIDKSFRHSMKKYVKHCVSFTEESTEIFGIDVIKLSNAIDGDIIQHRKKMLRLPNVRPKKQIVFTAVASMYFWHGYDRFIKAIEKYYHSNEPAVDIVFNIVGEGDELESLKRLSIDKNLDRYILFHGYLEGKELEQVLLSSHIGLDSLGRFRAGNDSNNSLKSKEYLSYGLPIVKSHFDSSVDEFDFVLTVANNESDIDIANIISWYVDTNVKYSRESISEICHKRFSWEVQFQNLFRKLRLKNEK